MSVLGWRVAGLVLALAAVAACGRRDRGEPARTDSTVPGAAAAVPESAPPAPRESTPAAAPARTDSARPQPRAPADTGGRQPTPRPARRPAQQPTRQPPQQPAQQPAPPPAQQATPPPAQPQTEQPGPPPLRDPYHQAPRDTVAQDVYDGWKLYNLNCARCHGEDVQGTTIAPHLINSLKPNGPINTKELFIQTVCAGRPEKGMPAWCSLGLGLDQIEKIYAYVKGRSEGKIGPGRPALRAS
jgi:mono/diheme cytochrome c family protein